MRKMLIKRILAIIVNNVLFVLLTTIFYVVFNCSVQVTGHFSAGFIAFIVVYICPAITNSSSLGYLCFNFRANSTGKLLAKYCIIFGLFYLPATLPLGSPDVQWLAAQIAILISLLSMVIIDVVCLILTKGKCDIGDYLLAIDYNANKYNRSLLVCQSIALFPISMSILLTPIVGSNIMWFDRIVDDFKQDREMFCRGYFPDDVFNDIEILLQHEKVNDVLLFGDMELFINSTLTDVLNVYILADDKIIANASKKQDLLEQLLKYIHLKYMWIDEFPVQIRFVFLNVEYNIPFVEDRQSYMYYCDGNVVHGGCDFRMLNQYYQDLCENYDSMLEESLRACEQDSLWTEYINGNKIMLSREVLDSLNAIISLRAKQKTLPTLSARWLPLHLVQEKHEVFIKYQIGFPSHSLSLDINEYRKERNAYDSLMFYKNRYEECMGY